MAIRVALNHVTQYRYDRLVTLLPHVVRLRPAPHCRTPILSYSVKVQPESHFLNWQQDPYSNYLARLVFLNPARELRVVVDLVAEMTAINPFDFFVEPQAEHYPFAYDPVLARELVPYLETAPAGPKLQGLVDELRRTKIRMIDYLVEINQHLQRAIRYVIRMEPGIQACEETLTLRSGSCRDSAWLLVQVLRHLGLAARFVSGYLIQLIADVKALDGPSGPEKDFTDLHAWAEVYLPGAGWVGLDPTSGLLAGEGHIPLACAAEPITAAPITGSYEWTKDPNREEDRCEEDFQHHMTVTRIHETPRVTKPYTEEEWQAIDALGRRIDDMLLAGDVRLTMGGEPTFVSVNDRDAPEWNTVALGAGKRRQAGELFRRLRDRFAPGALLHFGQGKWYPGESLPRWALGCYWRRDGVPVWENPLLVADENRNYGYNDPDARRFIVTLAECLEVDPVHCTPAYEDIWHYLWRERQLPVNVDPLDSRLEESEERERLTRIFDQGLRSVVGYALPLRRDHDGPTPRWVSSPWFLRPEHMFLIPGDSPMGFRLPLDSLPWEAPENRHPVIEEDPFAPREPLRIRPAFMGRELWGRDGKSIIRKQAPGLDNGQAAGPEFDQLYPTTGYVTRTALCVEARDGKLHVFMPPQRYLQDYLDLVAAVEATATALQMPVLVEGYTPPSDPRMNHFLITPDPGVIEVNIHPSHNWEELVSKTNTLYEEAHQSRLSTEKFMLDGRHAGTGGGNHVIIGGPTPADSPILRRPDLLRSLLGYWHNHPSLSYLFSGLFVGPTSQAPRVDEARNDSVYELELAFRQIPTPDLRLLNSDPQPPTPAPWLVDRVFRNLLTDVTGNTHRAEFCIDKLYSPESSNGRRGLVELRSYEMPPHAQMSLAQQLLLRALIARFWEAPYQQKLVRWGTELHDRFMLPHFVEQDFQDVLEEMRRAGFPIQDAWYAPHFEFRFPPLGEVAYRGINLELRTAIEPWHVLGEEQSVGGTARYVDSSVERLQVKARGMTDTRHVMTCNGRPVPLHPTGVNGEFVAGVRYRAWQPPSCLHPTVPVNTPLVFDLVDKWMGRSIGGCAYHVAHPGGRAHDTFPVNAGEAEGRRGARFFPLGHTPGEMRVAGHGTLGEAYSAPRSPECPFTLDLRQPAETILPPPRAGDPGYPSFRGDGKIESRSYPAFVSVAEPSS
jgi:uncharacterized protein (DUF2126 family)/transglutaminase-like putative cysteine protease